MFDDQVNSASGGQIPPNLPVGEPPDMFPPENPGEESDNDVSPELPQDFPPAPTMPDTALEAGILKPKEYAPEPQSITPEQSIPKSSDDFPPSLPPTENYQSPAKDPGMSKGIFIIVTILVGIALVGTGVWVAYSWFMSTDSEVPVTPTTDTPIENLNEDTAIPNDDGLSDKQIDDSLLFGEPIDQDGDGLDDVREAGIGSDAKNWDTDNDGLSDGDEVIIWKTNPLNPDSDNDSYSDGDEVKSGYSPTGAGKLFEPPAELK